MFKPRLEDTVNPAHPLVHLTAIMTLTDHKPETCFVDLGDKGSGVDDVQVIIAGQKRGVPESKKRWIRLRNSVEPVTVHLKSDGKMQLAFTY